MNIDDLKHGRRRVLQENKESEYSPKKRWDQGSFGSQRALLLNHVQNTLREHQNDGDILEKFRKQAQQLKEKKRRQKFPHLYPPQNFMENRSQVLPKIKSSILISPQNQFTKMNINPQPQNITIQPKSKIQYSPQLIYPMINPMQNYINELESRLHYERVITQKNLQLYKRQQKIKKQRNKIEKLYRQLKYRQKEDELQKYINYQNEIQRMNKALSNIQIQLSHRKQKFQQRKKSYDNEKDNRIQTRSRKNKSQIFLNYQEKLPTVSLMSENKSEKQQRATSIEKNPQIIYSPKAKKNKSSVFQNINLYNPVVKLSQVDGHLQELINYNSKLQYFHSKNKQKLQKIK